MRTIPRAPGFDLTLPFLRDPYRTIARHCRELGSDLFTARFLLAETYCMTGQEAAAFFYASGNVSRKGAAPLRIQKTLVGRGGVQGLDGEAHRHRKALFMSLVTPQRVAELGDLVSDHLGTAARTWPGRTIGFYDEAKGVLLRAVCAWAGVPLPADEAARRSREVAAMFDYAGRIGPAHWWARLARRRSERWAAGLVEAVREGRLRAPPLGALHAIAHHRDARSDLLPVRTAAVELLNVLRPTVAVAVFLAQLAHALHRNPHCGPRISTDPSYADLVAQEVRRAYPFFPAAVGRIAEDCTWQDHRLAGGRRVLFDIHGTNHDPRLWAEPGIFRPERFLDAPPGLYAFVPHGGGDPHATHRCPGEVIAHEILRNTARFLATRLTYEAVEDGIELDYGRLPALPRNRMRVQVQAVR